MLRTRTLAAAGLTAIATAACSIHPIPDDVGSRYSTEEIVRNVRCEAKDAVRERIRKVLHEHANRRYVADIVPDKILEPQNFERIKTYAPDLALKFQNYMGSGIGYAFEFNINERNDASASAGFIMPFTTGGNWAFGGGGGISKTREGVRKFGTLETFEDLIKLDCVRHGYHAPPAANAVYPMTGSVGIARVMNTFINLTELGGAKDTYTDQLTFTTKVEGNANASVVLTAINDKVRLAKATSELKAERTDTHKLTVSLTFPKADIRDAVTDRRISLANIKALGIDSKRRAQQDLCIAREEEREDRSGTLRQMPPEYYCRQEGRLDR